MAASADTLPSLADRARIVTEAEGPIVGVHFFRQVPVFVLGEEALLFAPAEKRTRVAIHAGGILASAGDGQRIVTGGDDGKLVATDRDGGHEVIATDDKKRWIDQLALGPDGAVAWSAGKLAHVRTGKGELREYEAPSTVAGLAFFPKGFRVAIAHYNGATLWFPNAAGAKPETLEWKGSHLGVTVSPDGKFLVTTMQEQTLHGWRIADAKHMRMSGYSARVRSLSWTHDGSALATSGSEQLILWPFDGKDGPMGRQPSLLAQSPARCSVVACHPKQPVAAAGFSDGSVLLVRLDDGALILAREADGEPVSALGWDASGQVLAMGTEEGSAAVLTL
ncbi:MAG: WD40 repeat domain-containing protein [Rhodopseudomonas sp.]|nr:WD40 repeat domain-containing protein [Rhodopseudomonas sp.]